MYLIGNQARRDAGLGTVSLDYGFVLDALPDAVLIHEAPSGRILQVNQGFLNMFGYGPEGLEDLDLERLIGDDEHLGRVDGVARIREALEKGKTEFPCRSLRADGTLFWSEVRLIATEGRDSGQVFAVVRDVSSRAQAEEALKLAEEKYETVFRSSSASIFLSGYPDGRLEEVNEAVLRHTGYSRMELIGRRATYLWGAAEARERYMAQISAQGRVAGMESLFRMKSGELRVGRVSGEILHLSGGPRILTMVEDITDQRQAAEELARASQDWQATFDAVEDAITLLDGQGRILRRNRAAAELASRGHGDPALQCRYLTLASGRQMMEWISGDRSYEVTLDPLLSLDGTVERIVHSARDVTQRKTSEAALTRISRLYAALSQVNQYLIRVQSQEELFGSICKALVEGGGFLSAWIAAPDPVTQQFLPLASYGGQPGWVERLHVSAADDTPEGLGSMGRAFREQQPVIINDFEGDARSAPWRDLGRTLNFRSAASLPLRRGNRAVFGVLCLFSSRPNYFGESEISLLEEVCSDITYALEDLAKEERRKQAEMDKDHLRELLQSIIDSTPDLIYAKDPCHLYLLVNRSMAEFLGRNPWEIIGHQDTEFWPEGVSPGSGENGTPGIHMDEAQALYGTVVLRELSMTPPQGGEPRIFDTLNAPLRDASGRIEGVLGYARDITRLKQHEAQQHALESRLQETQKQESLGNLAGGVAHDMNNVLGAILGLASIEAERSGPAGSARKSLDTIVQACVRGRDVVQGLLCFARRDLGDIQAVDVNGVAREVIGLLSHTTLQRVRFIQDFEPSLRCIEGNPSALNHAFMNLCVNSLDAMPQGGSITVRTRNGEDGAVRVEFLDTGEGMSEEVIQRATEPFFTTKPAGKGTGLGLAMVYGTVSAHKGSMTLSSKLGKGTQVKLVFPGSDAPLNHPQPGPEGGPSHGLKILLVDDDDLLRESVGEVLAWQGHTVEHAPGGQEALDLLAQGAHFDVLILDLNMPGLSGRAALPKILDLRPEQKILISSGYADSSIKEFTEARPQVQILGKPFTSRELAGKLRDLVN